MRWSSISACSVAVTMTGLCNVSLRALYDQYERASEGLAREARETKKQKEASERQARRARTQTTVGRPLRSTVDLPSGADNDASACALSSIAYYMAYKISVVISSS